jgi:hypothetical protein
VRYQLRHLRARLRMCRNCWMGESSAKEVRFVIRNKAFLGQIFTWEDSHLVKRNLDVFPLGQVMLLVVQLERLTKRQPGVKCTNGRHQLLQSRRSTASFHFQRAMLFNQSLKMAECIASSRLQAIQHKAVHEHLLHPFDKTIATMRRQQIVSSSRREGHCQKAEKNANSF